jgi:D-3-phosphoglycerate dehydrogenase
MIMGMGVAKQVPTLKELLSGADFVTLHVPELPETKNMISTEQFAQMKNGSYIINASRGSVIDIPALLAARKSGKIAGAAIDVFPNEPAKNGSGLFNDSLNTWTSELTCLGNIMLTPHIGGSTEEAQCAIGTEVGTSIVKYINEGSSVGSVNFPEVSLRVLNQKAENRVRVLYIHKNVPGVLRTVNEIFATHNIEKQFSDSQGEVAYLIADICDVNHADIKKLYEQLELTPFNIRTRLLY